MKMKVFWDIDGTIMLNPLPSPNWEDPAARHPTTGEPISGQMPIYNSRAVLNSELTSSDIRQIKYVITSRPEFRRETTVRQLQQHGIKCDVLVMSPEIYKRDLWARYKAIELVNWDADYYIDNDPIFCLCVQGYLMAQESSCLCMNIREWHDLKKRYGCDELMYQKSSEIPKNKPQKINHRA